ncbi:MAG: glycosyltransferase family 2 protein [Nanoarchaeota archaeon]|nr:glycosyltransferase family 2 protein [Nanoarchaeota archaeon]
MNEDLVSIIIINLNGKKWLDGCFCSLKKINYANYEIILVDNGSNDGSIEFVKENYPQVKIIQNEKNLGFAEANNIGYQNARGKYIFLLNNDTKVEPDFLTILVEEIKKDKNIGGVQPKIVLLDNPQELDSVGGFLTFTGFLYHFGYRRNASDFKYNQKMEIFYMKGAAMLLKKESLEKVGLFDKDFFAYFEETDLCHRLWLAGYKIKYIPQSVVYHKMGGTSLKINIGFIQFHSFKNRINSYIKNLGLVELLKILPLHLFLCLMISLVKPEYFKAIHKAIWWNILHIKETFQKRKIIQRDIRKIKDKDFIPNFKRKVRFSYYYYLFIKGFLKKYED